MEIASGRGARVGESAARVGDEDPKIVARREVRNTTALRTGVSARTSPISATSWGSIPPFSLTAFGNHRLSNKAMYHPPTSANRTVMNRSSKHTGQNTRGQDPQGTNSHVPQGDPKRERGDACLRAMGSAPPQPSLAILTKHNSVRDVESLTRSQPGEMAKS